MIYNFENEYDINKSCETCIHNYVSVCMIKIGLFGGEEGYCNFWEKHEFKAARVNMNLILFNIEERSYKEKRG